MKHIAPALVLLAACTSSPEQEEIVDDVIVWEVVSTGDVASQLDTVQLVDVRSASAYDRGHLPGALNIDGEALRGNVGGVRGQAVARAEALQLLESAGIEPGLTTVVYGDENDTTTARTLWSLGLYGAEDSLRLMDGGLAQWEDEGREVSDAAVTPTASSWAETTADDFLVVDKAWVLEHLEDADVAFFDVRSSGEYEGGHIPGAQNVEWTRNLDSDGLFLPSSDTLDLHSNPTQPTVVVYCQSGARASVSWALLDFAGLDVRLYDGSWNEWGEDPETPKNEGATP